MNTTTNLGLTLAEKGAPIDSSTINNNYNLIDTALSKFNKQKRNKAPTNEYQLEPYFFFACLKNYHNNICNYYYNIRHFFQQDFR